MTSASHVHTFSRASDFESNGQTTSCSLCRGHLIFDVVPALTIFFYVFSVSVILSFHTIRDVAGTRPILLSPLFISTFALAPRSSRLAKLHWVRVQVLQ